MALPDPPPDLPPAQQAIWAETLQALTTAGRTDRVDTNSLAAYVSAVHSHRQATTLLNQSTVLTIRDGNPVPNPALTVQREASTVIRAFARQFGLTRAGQPDQAMRPGQPIRPPGVWFCDLHRQWHGTCRKHGGEPCHGAWVPGLTTCRMHAGRGSEIKKAAAKLVPTYLGTRRDVTPAQVLLEEVQRTAGIVGWLDGVIAGLEQQEITWGIERETQHGAGEFPGADIIRSTKANVWVQLHQRERSHLVAVCEAALRSNIDERLVRLAEGQGLMMAQCLNLIFADLDLSPEQWARVPDVVPRRMREMIAA
jgi:P27 family predicted phage terminase small subunit